MDITLLAQHVVTKPFLFHSAGCIFILFVSFVMKKLLSLTQSNLFIFFFYCDCDIISKNHFQNQT